MVSTRMMTTTMQKNDEIDDDLRKDSPCIVIFDMHTRAMASWVMLSKSVIAGSGNA